MNTIVKDIPYGKEPSSPYQYTNEMIAGLEQLTGKAFPEDFKWYLLNVGWRRIAFEHRSVHVPYGEYIYTLQFEGVEHQTFSTNRYQQYLGSNIGEQLPYERALYYPFGKIEGEINPSVSFQLFISLNAENYGEVWILNRKIADSFTLFLAQISANDRLKSIARENNEALFIRLLKGAQATLFTTASNLPELLQLSFEHSPQFIVNGIRNVEFQHYDNGLRMENEQKLSERIDAFEKMNRVSALQRRDIRIGAPQPFDRGDYFRWTEHNYYIVSMDSIVGDQNLLKEEFLVYHDELLSQWSMVSRYHASIDDVKIKGVGTFIFDSTDKWELKKRVTPAWSELAAGLYIKGEEDAITAPLIAFVKEILGKADFKPVLDAFIADKQVCSNYNIYIDSDHAFHVHMDSTWDEEHGLSIRVKNWQIQ